VSRLRDRMNALAGEGRTALVAYVTCGDPSLDASVEVVCRAAEAGADVVELGMPFSDPNADGVVIQAAMQRALAAGGGLQPTLEVVRRVRARGCQVPVVLFGYYNPVFVRGVERFAAEAAEVGADALLTVDVPMDELAEIHEPLSARGLDVVPLVAPTSGPERMRRVRELAPPFVYYISMTGITGAALQQSGDLGGRVALVREATGAPVCVGFGIKTAADAARVGAIADGVVVGTALVQRGLDAGAAGAAAAIAALVAELRAGLDG
jgi:tryptophan synthase alpha chain